jgi:photosystem II stability/assembly factor-like uncharacterized protein
LQDGKVLVAGGFRYRYTTIASSELYDPATGTWVNTRGANTGRELHTATLLDDGSVLVAGGDDGCDSLANSELYHPTAERWSFTGSLNTARTGHTVTLLRNGKVLVAGGGGSGGVLASTELYEPGIAANGD